MVRHPPPDEANPFKPPEDDKGGKNEESKEDKTDLDIFYIL